MVLSETGSGAMLDKLHASKSLQNVDCKLSFLITVLADFGILPKIL